MRSFLERVRGIGVAKGLPRASESRFEQRSGAMTVTWARVAWAAAVAIALCSAGGRLDPCPEVQKTQTGVHLKLSSAIARDLQATASGFKPLTMTDFSNAVRQSYKFSKRQAPWAVIGDFDGDGFCDLVIDGRNKTESFRLCAWGTDSGPRVIVLSRRRLKSSAGTRTAALTLVSRDQLGTQGEQDRDQPSGEVFGEQVSEKLTRIYYWRQGHFVQREVK